MPDTTATLVVPASVTGLPSSTPDSSDDFGTEAVYNIFNSTFEDGPIKLPKRGDHPVGRTDIAGTAPVGTNKFYGNLLVGLRNQAVWTHPYSVWWPRGSGMTNSWGLAISHTDASQRVFGPGNPTECECAWNMFSLSTHDTNR